MLFHGKKLDALAIGDACVPRPDGADLFFKVRAIAHGDETKGKRLFPNAVPPTEFLKDAKGKPLRDPRTGRVLTGENYENPAYLSEAEKAERLQMVVMFVDSLDQDPNVAWECDAAPGSSAYYEQCDAEITAAGLTVGDIRMVLDKALELGNLDGDAIKRSAEAFSRRDGPQETE